MISFDFEYYRPDTLKEAHDCCFSMINAGKAPVYYAGGTELISMARAESVHFGSAIDLKGIPECRQMGLIGDHLVVGSCVTLTEIAEANYFPLLSETVSRIADHTIQDKITLGGNLLGTIQYREAALPLLITSCTVSIFGKEGLQNYPMQSIFDGRMRLNQGDILVDVRIPAHCISMPYVHVKKTKSEKIDYPLLTLCGIKSDNQIHAAVSGIANAPVILPIDIINDCSKNVDGRIQTVLDNIRDAVIGDLLGSREYREFVLNNVLRQMYENFDHA